MVCWTSTITQAHESRLEVPAVLAHAGKMDSVQRKSRSIKHLAGVSLWATQSRVLCIYKFVLDLIMGNWFWSIAIVFHGLGIWKICFGVPIFLYR